MGLYRKKITTPCGPLTLLCDGRALVAIRFGREADGEATTGTMQACPGAETRKKEIPAQEVQTAQEVLAQAAREIGESISKVSAGCSPFRRPPREPPSSRRSGMH